MRTVPPDFVGAAFDAEGVAQKTATVFGSPLGLWF